MALSAIISEFYVLLASAFIHTCIKGEATVIQFLFTCVRRIFFLSGNVINAALNSHHS